MGKIKVKDYLLDLEKRKLQREPDGFYSSKDEKVSDIQQDNRFMTCLIDGVPFILKKGSYERFSLADFITELHMGGVYNDLGVNSAEYYPMYLYNDQHNYRTVQLASQDLKKLDGIELVTPRAILDNIFTFGYTDSWKVLYSFKIKDQLLEYMTEECFDKMIQMFLLDTLTAQGDRHNKNFFFVKRKGSKLCEDVVAIDNEVLNLNLFSLSKIPSDESFDNFIKSKELMYFPMGMQQHITYEDINKELNKLIASSNLPQRQVDFIKRVLDHDIARSHSKVADKYDLPDRSLFLKHEEMLERLWDYNRNTLELS